MSNSSSAPAVTARPRQGGETAAAAGTISELRRRAAAAPASAAAWSALGQALHETGGHADAVHALTEAATLDPENPRLYRALAAACRARGDAVEGMAAELAATALEARSPLALYNLATACLQAGQRPQARRWYELTLRLDPTLIGAHRNLAAILDDEGRHAEARRHRDQAYRRQSIFVETAVAEERRVLMLAISGYGNVPIDDFFAQASTTRIKWFVDYAQAGQSDRLPAFDLIFNAIGDPDMTGPLLPEVRRFLERGGKPLLNRPEAVARTARHLLPATLLGIDHVDVPAVLRLGRNEFGDARLGARFAAIGGAFPALLRPAGAHGGRGVSLIETAEALAEIPPGPSDSHYLTAYRDCRSADGHVRKYRMIFVDREPHPCHLAISEHWLVHYFSADMQHSPWKRAEEQRFLEDPAGVLGAKAMAAIAAIGRRVDLDFAGIDFAIDGDGRVVVFEANATMLVHLREPRDTFLYKHVHVPRIFQAFETMLVRRLAAPSR